MIRRAAIDLLHSPILIFLLQFSLTDCQLYCERNSECPDDCCWKNSCTHEEACPDRTGIIVGLCIGIPFAIVLVVAICLILGYFSKKYLPTKERAVQAVGHSRLPPPAYLPGGWNGAGQSNTAIPIEKINYPHEEEE